MATSLTERAIALAGQRGIARARDFRDAGIPLAYLKRLCDEGRLLRLSRGLYQLPDLAGTDAAHSLAEVARLVPKGVVSLLSALRYHNLTTQLPAAVWLTIPHKARLPKLSLALEIVRATGPGLTAGIETVSIEGVDVPIYGIAKTVADCFKYRRRVGTDIAIEALRDAVRQRRSSIDELMRYAAVDRVAEIMRTYLEAIQ